MFFTSGLISGWTDVTPYVDTARGGQIVITRGPNRVESPLIRPAGPRRLMWAPGRPPARGSGGSQPTAAGQQRNAASLPGAAPSRPPSPAAPPSASSPSPPPPPAAASQPPPRTPCPPSPPSTSC